MVNEVPVTGAAHESVGWKFCGDSCFDYGVKYERFVWLSRLESLLNKALRIERAIF